jgi:spermidine synthase
MRWIASELKKYDAKQLINTDFSPQAMFSSLIYWQSIFAPNTTSWYTFIVRHAWVIILIILLWLLSGYSSYIATAFTTGSASMSLQMLSIWGLQMCRGSIYHWIGALSTAFMAGIALGAFIIQRSAKNAIIHSSNKRIAVIELFCCIWIAGWWMLITSPYLSWKMFFIFSAGAGMLLGLELPLITTTLAEHKNQQHHVTAGTIYTADLLGGWAAALVGGAVLIPAWGFDKTILLILIMKTISCLWWAKQLSFRNN